MKALLEWLKWRVAPREMAELERWRVNCKEYRRWMAEFPAAREVLDGLEAAAQGRRYFDFSVTREALRREKKS